MTPRRDLVFSRRAFLSSTGLLTIAALAACAPEAGGAEEPAQLTTEQAERLASFRFKNYLAESVTYAISGPESFPVTGSVQIDTQVHRGTGLLAVGDGGESLVAWGAVSIFTCADATLWEDLSAWSGRDIDSTGDIDAFLLMLVMLSSDRPENVQLLQQSGAVRLGTEKVNGVVCDVFTGPGQAASSGTASAPSDPVASPVRYLLDRDGQLQSFSAQVSSADAEPWTAVRTEGRLDAQIPDAVWEAMDQAEASKATTG